MAIPSLLRVLAMVFVATAMLSLGVQTSARGIRDAVTDRDFVARALFANLVLAPALGLLVALWAPVSSDVKLGIALLALAPGAPFGLQFTRLVKQRAALAVAITLVLTLISILYTPLAASLLLPLEAPVRLPYARVLGIVVLCLALPVAVGAGIRQRTTAVARALVTPLFLLATASFLAIMVLSAELRRQAYQSVGLKGLLTILVFIAGTMALGWWLGGPARETRRLLAAVTSLRNAALSYLVATSAFPRGNVDVVVLAFFALMIPANLLLTLGLTGYERWRRPAGRLGETRMSEQSKKTTDELAQERTDLALQRTHAAADRTLMAWIRTSLSMISFGFTIFKFFQYLRESGEIAGLRARGARHLGLTLIALGTVALILATLQHRQYLRRLGLPARQVTWSLTFLVASLLAFLGVLVFLSLLLRIGPF